MPAREMWICQHWFRRGSMASRSQRLGLVTSLNCSAVDGGIQSLVQDLPRAISSIALGAALSFFVICAPGLIFGADIQACFSPPLRGGCDPQATLISAIDGARRVILVQAYALTSREITTALIKAHSRGVQVKTIVDRSQLSEDRSGNYALSRLLAAGMPIMVDSRPASHTVR